MEFRVLGLQSGVRWAQVKDFGKVIDQCPEEDVKCLRFTRLRIQGYTRTSYNKRVKHVENELRTKLESEQRQSRRSGGWSGKRISRED